MSVTTSARDCSLRCVAVKEWGGKACLIRHLEFHSGRHCSGRLCQRRCQLVSRLHRKVSHIKSFLLEHIHEEIMYVLGTDMCQSQAHSPQFFGVRRPWLPASFGVLAAFQTEQDNQTAQAAKLLQMTAHKRLHVHTIRLCPVTTAVSLFQPS